MSTSNVPAVNKGFRSYQLKYFENILYHFEFFFCGLGYVTNLIDACYDGQITRFGRRFLSREDERAILTIANEAKQLRL